MQNRYVGDIGDYFKYGMLRRLAKGRRLGVMWYLFPNEDHNNDGGHLSYLDDPDTWRHYDPELYDLEADPDELIDLGTSADHSAVRRECLDALHSIVDPDAANAAAFASQAALIDALGGPSRLDDHRRFNHTPTPE